MVRISSGVIRGSAPARASWIPLHDEFGADLHALALEVAADLVAEAVVDPVVLILELGYFSSAKPTPED